MGRFKSVYQIYDLPYFAGSAITPVDPPSGAVFRKRYNSLEVHLQDGAQPGQYKPTKLKESFRNKQFYGDVLECLIKKYGVKRSAVQGGVSDSGLEAVIELKGSTIREGLFGHSKSRKLKFTIDAQGNVSAQYQIQGPSVQYMILADINRLYKVLNKMAKAFEKNPPAPAAPAAAPAPTPVPAVAHAPGPMINFAPAPTPTP